MSSRLSAIITAVKSEITANTIGYSEAKFRYDLSQNSSKTSSKIYSVTPKDGSSSVQTNLAWTVDQDIHVSFCQTFSNKNDSDSVLDSVIMSISEDIEVIGKQLFKKRLGLPYVLGVLSIDVDEPLINNEDNNVTLNLRIKVRYRMEY